MTAGEFLKAKRFLKGYTLSDLSKMTNKTMAQLYNIEAGRTATTAKTFKIIADALELSIEEREYAIELILG